MSTPRIPHRSSLEQYEQMIESGVLTENDRVELIRGEIIPKMPIGKRHAACVKRLNRIFSLRLAGKVTIGIQDPIRCGGNSPQPDVTLLIPSDDEYAKGHPKPHEIVLVVEVADSSIDFDRDVKRSMFAENGITEYWVLDVARRTLEVHRQPLCTGYYVYVETFEVSAEVEIERLPGEQFVVGDFFPR